MFASLPSAASFAQQMTSKMYMIIFVSVMSLLAKQIAFQIHMYSFD